MPGTALFNFTLNVIEIYELGVFFVESFAKLSKLTNKFGLSGAGKYGICPKLELL